MKKKAFIKAAVIYATFLFIVLIVSDAVSGKFKEEALQVLLISNLVKSVIGGVLFTIIMKFIAKKALKSADLSQSMTVEIDADEKLIFSSGANHFKGWEGVGGMLFLTNKRLFFKSHKLNIQKHELSISLEDISKIEKFRPLKVTDNGLEVITSAGRNERFVVQERDEWIRHLSEIKPLILKG